jgi:hypothetical protein
MGTAISYIKFLYVEEEFFSKPYLPYVIIRQRSVTYVLFRIIRQGKHIVD